MQQNSTVVAVRILKFCRFVLLIAPIFLIGSTTRALPKKLRIIPLNSMVEGSMRYGGIQPDYFIDSEANEIQNLLRYATRIKNTNIDIWEKIERISTHVHKRVLPNTDYKGEKYIELVTEYKKKDEPVPLSAYIKCKSGVCREYALLTHLLLREAGIPNFHAYAEIKRASISEGWEITEDHGFTVVKVENKKWAVDPYYWGFHGFQLSDLMSKNGITEKSISAPIAKPAAGFRKIIKLHSFPEIWQKKSDQSCQIKLGKVVH